jgi:hypothetical protein
MAKLEFITKYKKNEGLVMSPEELIALYFYGININNAVDGSKIDDYSTRTFIMAAQQEIEKYLDIKLFPKLISEKVDYYRDDYNNSFPFFRVSLPVRKIRSLTGMLNGIEQMRYPGEWLQCRETNDGTYYRQFSVIPNGSSIVADANVILIGITAQYGLRSYPQIPNYWSCQYETGYEIDKIPFDLINIIGMLSAIPVLAIAGDIVLGAGVSSQSLGIDGLSQSVSLSKSAENSAYGARIKEYKSAINTSISRLKRYYKGITMVSL